MTRDFLAIVIPAISNSQIADDSRPAVTAAGGAIPPSLCSPAAVLNSVVAGSCRSAPVSVETPPQTSAASDPSPVVRAGSGAADFSDLDSVIADLERIWLSIPGAVRAKQTNSTTFRVAADSSIQFASSSSNIPTT